MARPRESYTIRKHKHRHKGDLVESRCYYIHLKDHLKIERELTGRPERDTTAYIAKNVSAIISLKAAGQPLSADLRDFIEGQPADLRQRLHDWGVLDAGTSAGFDPLMVFEKVKPKRSSVTIFKVTSGHVLDWQVSKGAEELSSKHIKNAVQRVATLLDGCGFIFPSDIDGEKAKNWISDRRKDGLSARTGNMYLASLKTFVSWMLKAGRISHNPIEHVSPLPEIEKRVKRRALTQEEIEALISTTVRAGTHHRLTGPERALIYRLALTTGLRANEIRTLTRGDFKLKPKDPYVTVTAARAKNRKRADQPLRPEIVELLSDYFKERPALPTARAFPGGWSKAFEMVRVDTDAAGILFLTRDGKADFHALRHTFGTMLARSGASPQEAMKLMRHSSIDLTMNLYTHLRLADSGAAVSKLPEIREDGAAAVKTGTFDAPEKSTAKSTKNPVEIGRNRVKSSDGAEQGLDAPQLSGRIGASYESGGVAQGLERRLHKP